MEEVDPAPPTVIKEKLANTGDDQHFHYQPYKLYWEPLPDMETPIRVQGELYTLPAFVEAHNTLQEAPGEPGCSLPRVIAALMFDSDATHLTTSGDAKLWPCYLWFGNKSKYRRSKPTHHLCNHVAYFQTLPDSFKDFAAEHCGPCSPSKKLFTHCRHEALHAQWEILLDDDFVGAYQHGIVMEYCFGTPEDMQRRTELARVDDEEKQRRVKTARDYILKKNLAISSKYNAFSKRLAPLGLGFNIYLALVVDLMHEFELGVWESLFLHILRILEAHAKKSGTNVTDLLDTRYRQVPSFGRDTIRRFSSNVSELKCLAARDYEDLLQCAIPVLDGLLPEPYNTEILTLVFICSHWHALAKLRMHTDCTLKLLDSETEHLGTSLRSFAANTCKAFNTQELAHSHSTEGGELEHRTPKTWYVRTSDKEFVKQMTGIERCEARIHRIREKLYSKGKKPADVPSIQDPNAHHHIGMSQDNHVDIGSFLRDNAGDPAIKVQLQAVCPNYCPSPDDTFAQDFWLKLKANLLPRILDLLKAAPDFDASGLPAHEECDADRVIAFKEPRIYQHQILHVNYTSYNVRRLQDIINARSSHNNIMVLSNSDDDTSPHFRYGRLLGTYHVKAIHLGPGLQNHDSHRMEFLWVWWYDQVGQAGTGWDHRRLDRVRFAPMNDDDTFGIVDPSIVLRGCHIIPWFTLGPKYLDPLQGLSHLANDSMDWTEYYVNRFVDRDMVMCYHFGLGVGHVYSHQSVSIHLPTPQVASSSSENRTTGNTDAGSSLHLATRASGSATKLDVTESVRVESQDSGNEDSDFEDFKSDISGGSSNESDGGGDLDSDFDNADLEELAAEEMYYN
ncbi:hypothetical protein FIBSPDRAFT_904798 [Athelia psychrophila]|uniref:Uncharacterized protein n=1 Tax=Athelia psychrophila TaxID=1759441 RepID=A0A167U9P2_9AGAM|nr:hypothetical protein FIBSPDRAFT_904798 [Fibularhizoctonia sp. CBS 109695]